MVIICYYIDIDGYRYMHVCMYIYIIQNMFVIYTQCSNPDLIVDSVHRHSCEGAHCQGAGQSLMSLQIHLVKCLVVCQVTKLGREGKWQPALLVLEEVPWRVRDKI